MTPRLTWTKSSDGSYSSEAGSIWKHPSENWATCCVTLNPALKWHAGRIGNLRDSKALIQRLWDRHMRKTGPLPTIEVMLAEFEQTRIDDIVLALINAVRGTTMMQVELHRVLGKWWRETA